jgi:hypothetical protein
MGGRLPEVIIIWFLSESIYKKLSVVGSLLGQHERQLFKQLFVAH